MGAFQSGFQMGQNVYQQAAENDIRRQEMAIRQAAEARAAEEGGLRIEGLRRTRDIQRDTDAAINDRADQARLGVLNSNQSGFTDASAQMLYGQGGQKAVDDAASYANAENARLALPQTNRTSLTDAPVEGATPATQGTVGYRKASARDRLASDIQLARASRDINAIRAAETKASDFDWYDTHNKMTDAELAEKYGPAFNANHALDGVLYFDPKTKTLMHKSYGADTPAAPLPRSTLLNYAHAAYQMGNGDVAAGLAAYSGLDEKQQAAAMASAKARSEQAVALHGAADKDSLRTETSRHNKAIEGITSLHYSTLGHQQRLGAPIQAVNDRNEPVVIQSVLGKDGKVTYTEAPLPAGLRLLKQVDPARVEARAQALVGQPTGRSVNGVKEVYTNATAYDAAYNQLANPNSAGSSALDKAIEARLGATGRSSGDDSSGNQAPPPVAVPGRPYYSTDTNDLRRMAAKPRGVSSEEASEAQRELDARIGESRMKAF